MFTLFYGPTSAYVHMIINMTYSAADIGFPSFPLAFFNDFLHKTCHILCAMKFHLDDRCGSSRMAYRIPIMGQKVNFSMNHFLWS